MTRSAFFISDSTGITAEALGQSLLAQFDVHIEKTVLPFVDTEEKARRAVEKINAAAGRDGAPPIVFDTIVNKNIRAIIADSEGVLLDIFATFLAPLENALGVPYNLNVGRAHANPKLGNYQRRIDAINYALDNDDGARINRYDQAQIILTGVSRTGKTPTCIYMAMQHGIFAANYPLTEDDLETARLPKPLQAHRHKLYGLTIQPQQLSAIRAERRANSRYATLSQCEDEVRLAERLFSRNGIRYIDSTYTSVEELATKILVDVGLREYLVL